MTPPDREQGFGAKVALTPARPAKLTAGTGRPPAGWDPDEAAERIRAQAVHLAEVIRQVRKEDRILTEGEVHAEADHRIAAEFHSQPRASK